MNMKSLISIFFLTLFTNAMAVPTVKLPDSIKVQSLDGVTTTYSLHENLNLLYSNNIDKGLSVYSYAQNSVYKGEGSYLGTVAENFEYCIIEDNTESCFVILKGDAQVVALGWKKSDQSTIVNGFNIELFNGNQIIQK